MNHVLIPLSQATAEIVAAKKLRADEPYDSVIRRAFARPSRGKAKFRDQRRARALQLEILGERFPARSAREVLTLALQQLQRLDNNFLRSLSRRRGRKRRIVARSPLDLYPGRPDLSKLAYKLDKDWWVGTNYSVKDVKRILTVACEVAGIIYEQDLKADL